MLTLSIHPSELTKPSDWEEIVSDLEAWGEVPEPDSIVQLTSLDSDRGPVANLTSETE